MNYPFQQYLNLTDSKWTQMACRPSPSLLYVRHAIPTHAFNTPKVKMFRKNILVNHQST